MIRPEWANDIRLLGPQVGETSLGEFSRSVDILHGRRSEKRIVCVLDLRIYGDESGTDSGSRNVVVAGYLAPEADWNVLRQEWTNILKCFKVAFFRMTDLQARKGGFCGWSDLKVACFLNELIPKARDLTSKAIAVFLLTDDWNATWTIQQTYDPGSAYEGPVRFLFRYLQEIIHDWHQGQSSLPQEESIAFIFEPNEYAQEITAAHTEFIKDYGDGRVGGISFPNLKKADEPAFQAADLLAWEFRTETYRRIYAPSDPPRPTFEALANRQNFICGQITRSMLEERVQRFMKMHNYKDLERHAPTQTTPKGYEIPVPKRGDVLRNLKKAAKPLRPRRPNK